MGLAHQGETDVCCDICSLPIKDSSVDMIFSSSIMEHVYNPEKAVGEMMRVLKPGGIVYTEIPFMRAYHMAPVDYQRYTYSGIEELFSRHGFAIVSKGVYSGPFTALSLFIRDFLLLLPYGRFHEIAKLIFSIALHPIKYFDLLVEDSDRANILACNFYYYGKKPE